jgi:hypothetical protein
MKVKVEIWLEVNDEGWMMDNGIPKNEVREDVKSFVQTQMQEASQNFEVV